MFIRKFKKGIQTMAMSVYNQNYKLGIDTSILKQVSAEILKRAEQKNSQYNVSSFNSVLKTVDIGVDLYKGNIDTATARQIALNNSGLQVQLSQNAQRAIQFLNTQAASQSVQKNVEGKITVAVNEISGEQKIDNTPAFNSIVANSASKDKNGSNPFYHGEMLMQNSKKGETAEESQSIFS